MFLCDVKWRLIHGADEESDAHRRIQGPSVELMVVKGGTEPRFVLYYRKVKCCGIEKIEKSTVVRSSV